MTRSTLIALTLAALHIVGCASAADTAAVVRSEDEASETTMELVETHHEGIVEVELTLQRAGEWTVERFEWTETEEPPPALLVVLSELEAALLENAREIERPDLTRPTCAADPRFAEVDWREPGSRMGGQCPVATLNSDPTFALAPAAGEEVSVSAPEVSYVWLQLLEEAAQMRLENERSLLAPEFDGCEAHEGFTDCVRAAR